MAVLRHATTGQRVELATETLVGRSASCGLVIAHPLVSSLHARIRWQGRGWSVQDLSRNGTWVNTRPADRETGTAFTQGDKLCFGQEELQWEVMSAEPPQLAIVPCDGGPLLSLTQGPVPLPSEDAPVATLWLDGDGFIVLENASGRYALTDNQVFTVNGVAYRVQAPYPTPPTAEAAPGLAEATLNLTVSRHEEHIEARLVAGGRTHSLRSRTHFQLLLLLARERQRDQASGVAEPDQGWVNSSDLCSMLQSDRATINTHVYRLRKQFSALELRGASDIVERRFDSDEIRLGCRRVEITQR